MQGPTRLGTQYRRPQENSRGMIGICLPLHSKYFRAVFVGFVSPITDISACYFRGFGGFRVLGLAIQLWGFGVEFIGFTDAG